MLLGSSVVIILSGWLVTMEFWDLFVTFSVADINRPRGPPCCKNCKWVFRQICVCFYFGCPGLADFHLPGVVLGVLFALFSTYLVFDCPGCSLLRWERHCRICKRPHSVPELFVILLRPGVFRPSGPQVSAWPPFLQFSVAFVKLHSVLFQGLGPV